MSSLKRVRRFLPATKPERLVAVAIRRDGEVLGTGHKFRAHWELRDSLGDKDTKNGLSGDEPGFLTDSGRFLTREEAVPVAVAAGQISDRWLRVERDLLSSDINW